MTDIFSARAGQRGPTRREFLKATFAFGSALAIAPAVPRAVADGTVLPKATGPAALPLAHFPDRWHAVVWRNWSLVPIERIGKVLGASAAQIAEAGKQMGLADPGPITADQERRSYITVIRRNWHLLPYEQLLELLDWTPEQLAFTLREDDFLYAKLGNAKPVCDPVRYSIPARESIKRAEQIASVVRKEFANEPGKLDPLFGFIGDLSKPPRAGAPVATTRFSPRFCYSYFAVYGDPLLGEAPDPYPDGYLAQLAGVGADGVWLQGVLHKLAPFRWDPAVSERHEERLARLAELVRKARAHGIGVYLYLNEPRAMPLQFFAAHPELKGVTEGEYAALCTSHPDVQAWLTEAVATVCRKVPDLAGFFTITASENLTNCWSHHSGKGCSRCRGRVPAEVIAEVNTLVRRGIEQGGSRTRLIAWDWGWPDDWAERIIERLPAEAALMSVSEWSLPIERGGVRTQVGEYSLSSIGPGPRARRHWGWARKRGLKTLAKVQVSNTWELSAVPYIPALENVARHASNLLEEQVDGLMLGWTLGGYPSPNLEMVSETARVASELKNPGDEGAKASLVSKAMRRVAERRFGEGLAEPIVQAWQEFSAAFRQFPFDGSLVYNAPMQYGPSNLLWGHPTGYHATMIGFPYDDLDGWRGPYPAEIFVQQFEKVADGFDQALRRLNESVDRKRPQRSPEQQEAWEAELRVAEACAIHFRTTANQARFVLARRRLAVASARAEAEEALSELERLLRQEAALARRLWALQKTDSRIGFEASNQYYYVPVDLVEKFLNCQDLLERWLPEERKRRL